MATRSLRLALASLAVLAVPITAYAAAEPAMDSDYYKKKICTVTKSTGSRLARVRRCRSQAEEDKESAESKTTTDRITSGKNYGDALHNRAATAGYNSGGAGGGCRATIRRC